MTDERSDNNISSANNSNDLTDERSDTNVPTANNPNDCGQDIAPESTQKIGKCLDEQVSSRRRSSRDVNSIRLSGVGKTAHTFYRRLSSLFFSDPGSGLRMGRSLFCHGSRRRKKNEKSTNRKKFGASAPVNKRVTQNGENDANSSVDQSICIEDQCQDAMQVERVTTHEEPAIYVIDNFLTDSELDYFDKKIASIAFERSFVDNMELENNNIDEQNRNGNGQQHKKKRKRKTIVDDSQRTSTFFSFRKLHDNKISALEQRIADTLGCWVHQIEALQLVRYLPGQFFGIHHDLGNLLEDDTVELPRKDWLCKRRLVTMFCYLNTLEDDAGGATYFPKCGHLRVRPKRGRAVLWCNITQDGKADSRTIHAGEAVNVVDAKSCNDSAKACSDGKCGEGEHVGGDTQRSKNESETTKYGLNIWICEE